MWTLSSHLGHVIKGSCGLNGRSLPQQVSTLPSSVLICHMTSHDYLIEGLCKFMVGRFLQCHHPDKIGDHRYCGSGDKMFLTLEEEEVYNSKVLSFLIVKQYLNILRQYLIILIMY